MRARCAMAKDLQEKTKTPHTRGSTAQCFPTQNRFFFQQFFVIMEAYQSEFCDDEFYNILETISPFATSANEVEFCPRCKSAPCSCMKVAGFKVTAGIGNNRKRYLHNLCNVSKDLAQSQL